MTHITLSNRAALVMSAAALLLSVGFAGGPVVARAITANSDKVDGLHAVPASASTAQRKGKLVAADPGTGMLRANVIPPNAKFPAIAPVGLTMTGMWGFDTQSSGTDGDYGSLVDFQTRLPADVVAVYSPTGGSVTHCPGNVSSPAAAAGYMCFYLYGGSGLDFTDMLTFSLGSRGMGYRFSGTSGGANADVFANGTWALTTAAFTPMKGDAAAAATK